MVRRRLVVRGRVQGVFFRDTVRRKAEAESVAGWARNAPDGSVEIVLEGDRAAVERVVAVARRGPEGARVDAVDETPEEPEGVSGFAVR
jgi:acylphosphatase